jgi:hypothetical protein
VLLHSDPALALDWAPKSQAAGAAGKAAAAGPEGESPGVSEPRREAEKKASDDDGGGPNGQEGWGMVGQVVCVAAALGPAHGFHGGAATDAAVVVESPRTLPARPTAVADIQALAEAALGGRSEDDAVAVKIRYSVTKTPSDGEHGGGGGMGMAPGGRRDIGWVLAVPGRLLGGLWAQRLLAEAHALVGSGLQGVDQVRLEDRLEQLAARPASGVLGGGSIAVPTVIGPRGVPAAQGGARGGGPGGGLLAALEAAVALEVAAYQQRVWEGLDPATAQRLHEAEEEVPQQHRRGFLKSRHTHQPEVDLSVK